MNEATLLRYESAPTHTRGKLILPSQTLHTLEPPWKDNAIGRSCVPQGAYRCVLRKSPKYGWKYWLQETEPRSFILIHGGNLVKHTLGCILPGTRKGTLGGQPAVLNSRQAVGLLHTIFDDQPFLLRIENA